MDDFREGLIRQMQEADLATGRAAEGYLPRFVRLFRHHERGLAAARNPFLRRYHRWRLRHYGRLVSEAQGHIETAREIRLRGLAPRR